MTGSIEPIAMPTPSLAQPTWDTRSFRDVLGQFPTGIAIVTTRDTQNQRPVGLAVSSFNSLSLDPPLILWSIGLKSSSLPAFRAHDHFAVNVLANDQEHLCKAFGRSGPDKFEGVDFESGINGVPLLAGVSAHLQCETVERYPAGDHELYIGRVVAIGSAALDPLVFHGGSLRQLRPRSASGNCNKCAEARCAEARS